MLGGCKIDRVLGGGGQAAARFPKLRVERRPFLAPEAVIFGVVFTGPYILGVKYPLKLVVHKGSTGRKARPSPRIESTGLELDRGQPRSIPSAKKRPTYLNQRVRRRWTLLHVLGVPISRQFALGPHSWVCTVETKRITIMPVDIHLPFARTWRIGAASRSIIANQRHHDPSLTGLVLDILHVVSSSHSYTRFRAGRG